MTKQLIIQPTKEDVERIFFNGMLKGWAGGFDPKPGILPDHWQYDYEEDDFRLMDMFYISKFGERTRSKGSTLILWRNQVAWSMHYGGFYDDTDSVLEFLQAALYQSYSNRLFLAGRGPTNYVNKLIAPNLTYRNHIQPGERGITYSQSRDHIYDARSGRERGFHDCWCQLSF
jgi:hypothetical protein